MQLTELALANFRTYQKLNLNFTAGVTVFAGQNGAGKTNLVEAINYVATIGSHRVANRAPLIALGAERAIIQARIKAGDRTSAIELEIKEQGSNKARINGGQLVPSSQARGILRAILFAPEDLSLVKGDPDGRRRFLDDLVLQARPVMAGTYRDYDQVLRQRNALLRNTRQRGGYDPALLEILDEQLVSHGAAITAARQALVVGLNETIAAWYQRIAHADTPVLTALTDVSRETSAVQPLADIAAGYTEQLAARRNQELERGMTLVGPQRDDWYYQIGEFPAKGYASHGESWSLALALKLAAFEYLGTIDLASSFTHIYVESEQYSIQQPILLLDDVFSELDNDRRAALSNAIKDINQVFITTAVVGDIPAELEPRIITVTKGQVDG